MSSPTPVYINQLSIATELNDSDYFVVAQGDNDRKLPASIIKAINWAEIPQSNVLNNSDLVLVYNGSGSVKVPASLFNIPSGTLMWFFQAIAPNGWTLIAYPGDALLGLRGGTTYNTAGTIQGTWQQSPHTLTVDQMPNHRHEVLGAGAEAASGNLVRGWRNSSSVDLKTWNTRSEGNSQPHDHGATWRPVAYVGIICQKI